MMELSWDGANGIKLNSTQAVHERKQLLPFQDWFSQRLITQGPFTRGQKCGRVWVNGGHNFVSRAIFDTVFCSSWR